MADWRDPREARGFESAIYEEDVWLARLEKALKTRVLKEPKCFAVGRGIEGVALLPHGLDVPYGSFWVHSKEI